MNEKIDLALRILAWGLIAFAISVIVLKWLGVIHSPELLLESLLSGMLIWLVRIESEIKGLKTENRIKLDLLWSEFKKRKKL